MALGIEALEDMAQRYAREAVQLDQQGSPFAIVRYQKAVEVLKKLSSLRPEVSSYYDLIQVYERRIRELEEEGPRPALKAITPEFDQLVLAEKPDVKWDDVIDLEDAKRAIREAVIYPMKRPDLFPLGWSSGILLFGPPGCGKTLLVAAAATEIDAVFYHVDAASLLSKWLGESEKNIAQLFKAAREVAKRGKPAIIYIDEADSLLGKQGYEISCERRTRNQFLGEMDGIISKKGLQHVYVIAATNKPYDLDTAFTRRFQKRIYVRPPDFKSRVALFELYSRNIQVSTDVNFEKLAEQTEGYTGSDIRNICLDAYMMALREFFEAGERGERPRPVSMNDFLMAIKNRKPSISQDMLWAYNKWAEEFGAL